MWCMLAAAVHNAKGSTAWVHLQVAQHVRLQMITVVAMLGISLEKVHLNTHWLLCGDVCALTVLEVESLVAEPLCDEHLTVIHTRSLLLVGVHAQVPRLLVNPGQESKHVLVSLWSV